MNEKTKQLIDKMAGLNKWKQTIPHYSTWGHDQRKEHDLQIAKEYPENHPQRKLIEAKYDIRT